MTVCGRTNLACHLALKRMTVKHDVGIDVALPALGLLNEIPTIWGEIGAYQIPVGMIPTDK